MGETAQVALPSVAPTVGGASVFQEGVPRGDPGLALVPAHEAWGLPGLWGPENTVTMLSWPHALT